MRESKFTRSLVAALVACVMLAMSAATPQAQEEPGAGVSIRMARATWDTGWFPAAIYKKLLERLGYTVEGPTTLDNPPFYQAVAQGDMDLWVNGWFPLHSSYEKVYSQGAKPVGYVAKGGALEGYLVDKASVEKYGIATLDDFKRDEVKEAFDRDGDGKADLVACPPGWGCELIIEHHLDAYDLRDHINPIKASYAAAMADAIAAYGQGKPILFYTWTPNWTVEALRPGEDVMWIEVPEVDLPEAQKDLADAATRAGVEGCVSDPCKLGFPANDIRPVANTEFLKANPAVKALLENASVPIADIFAQNAKMHDGEDSPSDIEQHAADWIKAHEKQVSQWLEAARAAAD